MLYGEGSDNSNTVDRSCQMYYCWAPRASLVASPFSQKKYLVMV